MAQFDIEAAILSSPESSPFPVLENPTIRARGFADALVLIIESQQRRIEVAEDENQQLRKTLRAISGCKINLELNPSMAKDALEK